MWRAFVVFIALLVPFKSFAQQSSALVGVGASFPSLVYSAWSSGYGKERGQEVRYSATGSGDGIKQMNERKVDFGATDTPLTTDELKIYRLIQFPTMAGGIVPVVNLRGVASGALKLTGPVLADIFSGEIKTWDDPQIVSLNPGLSLPRNKIARIGRQDASGSTAILTEYLSKQSTSWASNYGAGKNIKWKGEVTLVSGNDGVAEAVKVTPSSIGYV